MTQHTEQNARTRDEIPVYSPAGKVNVYEHFREGRWERIPYYVYLDLPNDTCRIQQEDHPALVRLEDAELAVRKAEARGAEEHRQKDAERQEPVYQVKLKGGIGSWQDVSLEQYRERTQISWLRRILFPYPANVAALETNIALRDVIVERERQKSVEGWTPEHDDAHANSELARAAASYAYSSARSGIDSPVSGPVAPAWWPWSNDWWKPTTQRRDLVKAAALILAEIERLDRAALTREGGV